MKKAVKKQQKIRTLFPLPEVNEVLPLKKRTISAPDISTLNDDQMAAYNGIEAFLDNKRQGGMLLLEGIGGTGKSYLMAKVLENYMFCHKGHVACTATTNKAVKITYRMADYYTPSIEYMTIHKLMGLKETINTKTGEIFFTQDKQNQPTLDTYDVVFVDEVSMLNNDLLIGTNKIRGLITYIEEGLKIIFIGDRHQIPPVKSTDSKIFSKRFRDMNSVEYYELTKIQRQAADNPIIRFCADVRDNLNSPGLFSRNEDMVWGENKGVFFLNRGDDNDMDYFESLLQHIFCSPNFEADPDFGKVLCWRNKMVNSVNSMIRQMRFGEGCKERIQIGEKLVALNPIFEGEVVVLPNNEELVVKSYERKVWVSEDTRILINLDYYETVVEYRRMDNSVNSKIIKILTTESQAVHKEYVAKMKSAAAEITPGTSASYMAWANAFGFERKFADVGYNYCATIHKAQGSSYQNTFVFETDAERNSNIKERNRILYTGFSRPSQRLWVL